MTIGIIGPELSCRKTQKDLEVISPETRTILYIKEASADALEVIGQCEEECDAALFTGTGPCTGVTQRHDISVPYEYLPKESSSLTKAFWDMERAGYELDYFSLDVAEPHVIEDVFYEMNMAPDHVYFFPFESYDEQAYIDWHLELWNSRKTKVILTGFVRIYNTLKEQGYPVFYLPTTRSIVRDTFTRLMDRLALREAHYSRLAVEILVLSALSNNPEDYYSNRLKTGQVESIIIRYCQELQASFFSLGLNQYIIFTNRGNAGTERNYRLLYNLQNQVSKLGFRLNVGIGVSGTAYQSESNARKALAHSAKLEGNYIYLVDENSHLIGPLGQDQSLEYGLISSDEKIGEIAGKSNMSPANIAKLMSLIEARDSAVFDVSQLADCLHVSVRSAHRIIRKLMDSGYAVVSAKEGCAGAGRPKSLIEIRF